MDELEDEIRDVGAVDLGEEDDKEVSLNALIDEELDEEEEGFDDTEEDEVFG